MNISIQVKKNKINNLNIDKKLNDIEKLSVYLSQTIDDYKSLYRKDREVSQFNLNNAVNDSILLLEEEYKKYKIQVTVDISKDIYLNNYLNELQQVLQVILNNAKDALLEKQTINPNILIVAEKKEKQIILKISNNGGEIEKTIIDKIFNAHFTTKEQGEGIGLFMSQKIVTELMNASLTCHNIAGGTCFEIKFTIEQ
jgi:signal transduction histidine kinase